MTQKTFRLAKLLPAVAAIALLGGLPTAAQAAVTPCGLGDILQLEIAGGVRSEVRIVTAVRPGGTGEQLQLANGQWATQIWFDNDERWDDRMKMLRTAFALGQFIEIVSSDDNCKGESDEFRIDVQYNENGYRID